ncbi:ABC transporter ATP-binding protein [Georgenia sp. EYE_87]|uniref:ABC transporter ATP-binding protein n=1 Tax=Georgenia sp. EYE_87 TaxID=2853448 RepID=UPI002005D642|nr:ABC transporter ATP-binding protein [Georgenia sp. EYE_87]MCK6210274.1 ABC transporter ATP-binding protein [Georgenia sp. EYE_87]
MSASLFVTGFSREFPTPDGPLLAVSDVDISARPGEFVALVGPSGCGKSTLLRAVAGLDVQHSGFVRVGGEKVTGPSIRRGIVFQEPRLLPWLTVAENIGFGLRRRDPDRVAELVRLVGLEGFEGARPHQLSGGMAQRAAIARALAPAPEVLLLDEPFGALDAFTRIRLQEELQGIWADQGVTTVLITHDIDEAIALAQKVVVLSARPGRVAQVLPIDLPYPRDRAGEEFVELRRALLAAFHLIHDPAPVRTTR